MSTLSRERIVRMEVQPNNTPVCDHSLFSEQLHRAVYMSPVGGLMCRTCGETIK